MEEPDQDNQFKRIEKSFTLKKLAIPVPLIALGIAPILYFAGALFDAIILDHYGLGQILLDNTTQQVVEQGFTSLVVGISAQLKTFITLGYLLLVMVSARIGALLAISLSRGETNAVKRRSEITFKVLLAIASIPALFLMVFFPAGCAILAAKTQLRANDNAMAEGWV